ncbi:hypothetical protein SG34_013935 [Thalassomonas viridans]|uniref:Cytochrome C oxidase subunit III n=1 Tax=Thalassomonas viridans TaxID=137584 RepID=A0AAE9Z7W0_9GAMM|nr:hypothetical protein [Thalassomonas viridans]WDE07882.1 hypothetical protein SG34_013935 [Thalassomonas viridans]
MSETSNAAKRLAIISQSLYLANLLLIPGVCFIFLVWFFYRNRRVKNWGGIHLYRALQLSVAAGAALVGVPLLFVWFSADVQASLMMVVLYFVTMHAALVLVGMLNLSRAMARKLPLF